MNDRDRDNLKKTLLSNNNFIKIKELISSDNLIKCEMQLSDKKKIANGFVLFDSVLDVLQGGYAISYGADYLFSYGIEPCCGVVLYDNLKYILFHLDGRTLPSEVKKVTDSFGFNSDAKVLICPGVTCGCPGSFKYHELEKIYSDVGCDTKVCRINGTFGYIVVSGTSIRIGSALIKDSEYSFERQVGRRK